MRLIRMIALGACLAIGSGSAVRANDDGAEPPALEADGGGMTVERLGALIAAIDPDYETVGNSLTFTLAERQVMVFHDANADRMRIITAVAPASVLSQELAYRMLQANFDAVLDARYAIANELIWAAFIHPLSSLTDADLVSAIAQVVTSAQTFGSTFSSGAIVFGGGDSNGLHEELVKQLEELLEGEPI